MKNKILLASVCLGAALVAGCSVKPVTYGTGESTEIALARDLMGLASFGQFGKKESAPISYTERGPLVVPSEDAFASMPRPVDSLTEIDENFPGRQEELARIEEREQRRQPATIVNQVLGDGRSRALGNQQQSDEQREIALNADRAQNDEGTIVSNNERGSTEVGLELAKSPETLAAERGVTVEELPPALRSELVRERSILQRAGLIAGDNGPRRARLTDPPIEYRTIEVAPKDEEVEALIDGSRDKKKKRFIFF